MWVKTLYRAADNSCQLPCRKLNDPALAIALLDSGSADVVLIAPHWESSRARLMGDQDKLGPQQH